RPCIRCCLLFFRPRRRPGSSSFPYTTLFRSIVRGERLFERHQHLHAVGEAGERIEASEARNLGLRPPHFREVRAAPAKAEELAEDRKSTRLNSSHVKISYAVFCLKKKKITIQ